MSTKKIWLIALVFGLIAAGMLYLMLIDTPKQAVEPAITDEENEESEEELESAEAEEKVEEEIWQNEMLPVEKGKRAMTIAVADDQGVAGFIKPGSFVDVVTILITPEDQKHIQHDAATLLLQKVKVLAIGHAADDEETMKRYHMVTIEVTPIEGLTLGFATNYDLHLMLRNDEDNELEPEKTHVHEDDLHKGVFRQ